MNSTSQRISADGLFDCLFSTYSKGAIDKFRAFLTLHPFVTKWLIACDFVINEAEATNDAYVYTFFPHNQEIIDRKDKIKRLVLRDFKKTKEVSSELNDFFHSGETFSICLLTPKKFKPAGNIHVVRGSLDETLRNMRNWQDADTDKQKKVIKAFEQLREKANANNFNAELMSTMMVATVLAAFCAFILAKERKTEIVGWFPDRDNITTAYERIADLMFAVSFSAFCQRHEIDERSTKTAIGLPNPDPLRPNQTWYDELVRIPDFLAGPLAGWNYTKNLVTGRQKYVEILQGAVADNPYVMTLILKEEEKGMIGVSHLLCSKSPLPGVSQQAD